MEWTYPSVSSVTQCYAYRKKKRVKSWLDSKAPALIRCLVCGGTLRRYNQVRTVGLLGSLYYHLLVGGGGWEQGNIALTGAL